MDTYTHNNSTSPFLLFIVIIHDLLLIIRVHIISIMKTLFGNFDEGNFDEYDIEIK